MGLLGAVAAGAASGAGGFGADVAEKNIQSLIAEDRMKRLEEHRVATQEAATVRGEQRKIANDATVREQIFQETKARAPELRQIKVDDAMAVAQAEIKLKTDPANVKLIAEADAAKAKYAAVAAKDLQADLLKDPTYLKNMKAVLMAEHPERFAAATASSANAAKAQFDLKLAKDLNEARQDFSAAQNAGDPGRIRLARDHLAALEGTAGRAQQTADKAVMDGLRIELDKMRDDVRKAAADVERVKINPADDPNSPEVKARRAEIAAAQARVRDGEKRIKFLGDQYDAMLGEYRRQYGAREAKPDAPAEQSKPGLADTPKPTAAPSATIEYERGPDGKLRPKQSQK